MEQTLSTPEMRRDDETDNDGNNDGDDAGYIKLSTSLNNPYEVMMHAHMLYSDVASIETMQRSYDMLKGVMAHRGSSERESIMNGLDSLLGMASTLMLQLDTAKDYFMSADDDEMLHQTFELAQRHGKYYVVKELMEHGIRHNDPALSIKKEDYMDFLLTKAIPHLTLYREADEFFVEQSDLERVLDDYESVSEKKIDRRNVVRDVLLNLEFKNNLNLPKKLFLSGYSDDWMLNGIYSREFFMKKGGIRKNIDMIAEQYCTQNGMHLLKKIQTGDHDDYFPISSSLYLAIDLDSGKKIVLKENLRLYVDFSRPDGYNMEKEIYESLNEDVDRHKGIIKYLGSADSGGIEFLKFEYFEGKNLSNYTQKGHTITPNKAVTVIRKVSEIINYLHEKNIIYSDIKDTNVLLDRENMSVRLLDFGMARLFDDGLTDETKAYSLLSTPKYVPPEMGTRFTFSKKSDVFQLGILCYEMLTGHHPFARFDFKEGDGFRESEIMKYSLANITQQPDLADKALDVHPDISSLLSSSLEKDPEDRISMQGFYARIKKIEEDLYAKK